jgi:hypothetical protein
VVTQLNHFEILPSGVKKEKWKCEAGWQNTGFVVCLVHFGEANLEWCRLYQRACRMLLFNIGCGCGRHVVIQLKQAPPLIRNKS